MSELSNDAEIVAGSFFPTLGSSLVLHFEDSRPTARLQAALDELVASGYVRSEPYNRFGSIEYKPVKDCWQFAAKNARRFFEALEGESKSQGEFVYFEKIPAPCP